MVGERSDRKRRERRSAREMKEKKKLSKINALNLTNPRIKKQNSRMARPARAPGVRACLSTQALRPVSVSVSFFSLEETNEKKTKRKNRRYNAKSCPKKGDFRTLCVILFFFFYTRSRFFFLTSTQQLQPQQRHRRRRCWPHRGRPSRPDEPQSCL